MYNCTLLHILYFEEELADFDVLFKYLSEYESNSVTPIQAF